MTRPSVNPSPGPPSAPRTRWFLGLAVGWTLVVGVVWAVVVHDGRREHLALATVRAEEVGERDVLLHALLSVEGVGPSMQPGSGTPASPVPAPGKAERGSAALRRGLIQVRLIGPKQEGQGGSLDAWERAALERLSRGEQRVSEVVGTDRGEILRLATEAVMDAGCMRCHSREGLARPGEPLGAVSVMVPLDFDKPTYLRSGVAALSGLFSCWLLGLLGIRRGAVEWQRRALERAASERMLKDSERRFRLLAEEAPVGIFETDPSGRYTYVNRRWSQMIGLDPGEVGRADWLQSVHPEDRSVVVEGRTAEFDSKGESRREYRCVGAAGGVTWVQGSWVPCRDEQGNITGSLGVTMDVGDRRRAEESLRGSESRFRALFEEAPLGMALLDGAGCFLQANKALGEMLGRPTQALAGVEVIRMCHPADADRCRQLIVRSGEAPLEAAVAELRWMRGESEAVWAVMTLLFIPGGEAEGAPQLHLAMFRDTTAQREDAARLRQQAALLDIAQDAICVMSLEGRIEFWNPAAEKLYGWGRDEVMGRSADDLMFGRVSAELLQAREDVLNAGSWSGELQQAAQGGRSIQVQTRLSLVRDEGGQPRSVLMVGTDLTDRKRLEQQFLRAQRMECVGALASGIAHDLNNVFAPILMVAECLAGRPVSPMDAELLELLRSSADRGAGVVRQLLSFSRGQGMARSELRVDHLMKEMGRLANETFPKNIRFSMSAPPDLWLVVADPTQLHQVLLNLCVNARDAMASGGDLHLEVRNLRTDELFCQINREARPGPYVVLEVRDTGEGIPEEVRDRIFDPFFTTKQPGKGTGLGLSTVLNIVRAHGGFLEVLSRIGEGTRFRVFLPASERGACAMPEVPATPLPNGGGECVMVVDDEEAICRVASQLLERHGYRPIIAQDGVEALAQFAEHRHAVRVVLTDMMMPDMDGPSIVRAIRRVAAEVPIVAMSGSAAELRDVGFAAQGNILFLEKPFTAEQLLSALRDALAAAGPDPELPRMRS